jgi:transposase InsO family protein
VALPRDLLHVDTKRYARFERPGHRVTVVRDKTGAELRAGWGYEFAHSIVDDHSRLAYAELHPDERAETVVAFMRRALSFFESHGVAPRRLMSDNAWCYTHSRRLAELLAERGIAHLRIRPHRPQTNGKVERFQQTMAREWAYGLTYRTSGIARRPCHTGSTTTTKRDPIAQSGTGRPSAVFTMCRVRTSSRERKTAAIL